MWVAALFPLVLAVASIIVLVENEIRGWCGCSVQAEVNTLNDGLSDRPMTALTESSVSKSDQKLQKDPDAPELII